MSMTINELCVKRAKAWNDAKAYLDAHRREDGLLSPEEVAEYEKLEAKIVNLGAEIDRFKVHSAYIGQVREKLGIREHENYHDSHTSPRKPTVCPEEKELAIMDALKFFGMIE